MIQPNDPEDPGSATLATTRRTPEIPDPPEMREPAPPAAPAPAGRQPSRRWLPLAGLALALALGAAGTWIYLARPAAGQATGPGSSAPEAVPPELRPYLDQARTGDAKAMHMIALMYWNGLNVRQDRAKGLEWYKKAAAAGSTAAQTFLKDNGIQ